MSCRQSNTKIEPGMDRIPSGPSLSGGHGPSSLLVRQPTAACVRIRSALSKPENPDPAKRLKINKKLGPFCNDRRKRRKMSALPFYVSRVQTDPVIESNRATQKRQQNLARSSTTTRSGASIHHQQQQLGSFQRRCSGI
jgi:hypothetical protein